MLLGADTGYFIQYAKGNPRAMQIWNELKAGTHRMVISTLTLNELLVYFLRRGEGAKGERAVELMLQTPEIEVVPVSVEIAVRSARYRHGLGIPTVDSIILTTFLGAGCELALGTDEHFERAAEKKLIEVEMLG